jgi:hypothetical protein
MITELVTDPVALSAMDKGQLAVQVLIRKHPKVCIEKCILFTNDYLKHYLNSKVFELLEEIKVSPKIASLSINIHTGYGPTDIVVHQDLSSRWFDCEHADTICCIAIAWALCHDAGLLPKPEASNA